MYDNLHQPFSHQDVRSTILDVHVGGTFIPNRNSTKAFQKSEVMGRHSATLAAKSVDAVNRIHTAPRPPASISIRRCPCIAWAPPQPPSARRAMRGKPLTRTGATARVPTTPRRDHRPLAPSCDGQDRPLPPTAQTTACRPARRPPDATWRPPARPRQC